MTIIITIILTVLTLLSGVGIFYLGYRYGVKSYRSRKNPQPKILTEEEKTSIREGERLNKYLNNVLNYKV